MKVFKFKGVFDYEIGIKEKENEKSYIKKSSEIFSKKTSVYGLRINLAFVVISGENLKKDLPFYNHANIEDEKPYLYVLLMDLERKLHEFVFDDIKEGFRFVSFMVNLFNKNEIVRI